MCVFEGRWIPEIMEALALREALTWIKERQRTKVEIESDCLNHYKIQGIH